MTREASASGANPNGSKRSNTVLSVVKALGLLESLAGSPGGVALSELSRRNELHPSTAHRILHTLMESGYVRQDPDDRTYHLGSGAMNLAAAATRHLDVRSMAGPSLRHLAAAGDETASLVMLDEGEIVYVAQAESSSTVRTSTSIGSRAPAYCTAGGKALLAHLPRARQAELLAGMALVARTSNTLTDRDAIQVELERIRRRGYAVDDEEYEQGMRCLAAPVHDRNGEVVAAVEISGPSTRITIVHLTDLAQQVQGCAREISQALGFATPSD